MKKNYKMIYGCMSAYMFVVLFYLQGRFERLEISYKSFIMWFIIDFAILVYTLWQAGAFNYDGQENNSETAKSNKSEI